MISNSDITEAVSTINPIVFQVINAVIILLIGFVIGKILQKLSLKIFEMIELDRITRKRFKIRRLSKILSSILESIIYIIAIIIALNKLNIATTIVNTIIILLLIVMIMFIVFGVNDIFANFFAGIFFRMRKNISVGEEIRIKDKKRTIQGKIEKINMLDIRINTGREELIIIPNTLLSKSIVTKTRKNRKN